MHIALVISEFPSKNGHGGLATYTCNMAKSYSDLGHQVTIFYKQGFKGIFIYKNIKFLENCYSPVNSFFYKIIKLFFFDYFVRLSYANGIRLALKKLQKENNYPEIIQVPDYNGEAYFLGDICIPLVVRFHTPTFLVDKLNNKYISICDKLIYRMEGRAINNANCITSSSIALKEEVSSYYNINKNNISVVRNSVKVITNDNIISNIDSGFVKLVFIGRLETRKGASMLPQIISHLLNNYNNITFTIIGDDTLDKNGVSYLSLLDKLRDSFPNRLIYEKSKSHKDILQIYKKYDILLMLSSFDNSPNVMFEAMASKMAILAPNVGGINEMAVDMKSAIFFEINDFNSFIQKSDLLINNLELRNKISKGALKKVQYDNDPILQANKTISIYHKLIKNKSYNNE